MSNTYRVTLRDNASIRFVYQADDYIVLKGGGVQFLRMATDPNAPVKAIPLAYYKNVAEVEMEQQVRDGVTGFSGGPWEIDMSKVNYTYDPATKVLGTYQVPEGS